MAVFAVLAIFPASAISPVLAVFSIMAVFPISGSDSRVRAGLRSVAKVMACRIGTPLPASGDFSQVLSATRLGDQDRENRENRRDRDRDLQVHQYLR